jgi:hypothetical protein
MRRAKGKISHCGIRHSAGGPVVFPQVWAFGTNHYCSTYDAASLQPARQCSKSSGHLPPCCSPMSLSPTFHRYGKAALANHPWSTESPSSTSSSRIHTRGYDVQRHQGSKQEAKRAVISVVAILSLDGLTWLDLWDGECKSYNTRMLTTIRIDYSSWTMVGGNKWRS